MHEKTILYLAITILVLTITNVINIVKIADLKNKIVNQTEMILELSDEYGGN